MDSAVPASIPGGRWVGDDRFDRAWIRPLVGRDEAALAGLVGRLPPPTLTTRILAWCVSGLGPEPFDEEAARRLAVGDREALLWQIRRATVGGALDAVIECEACDAKAEISLTVDDLLVDPDPDRPEPWTERIGDHRVRFRLPTGADQEALAGSGPDGALRLLASCVLDVDDREADRATLEAIEDELGRRLSELDPQAEALIDAACPGCGRPLRAELDAAAFLVEEVMARSRYLLDEVHLIAATYHWSEGDILSMPGDRRRAYAELIAADRAGDGP